MVGLGTAVVESEREGVGCESRAEVRLAVVFALSESSSGFTDRLQSQPASSGFLLVTRNE